MISNQLEHINYKVSAGGHLGTNYVNMRTMENFIDLTHHCTSHYQSSSHFCSDTRCFQKNIAASHYPEMQWRCQLDSKLQDQPNLMRSILYICSQFTYFKHCSISQLYSAYESNQSNVQMCYIWIPINVNFKNKYIPKWISHCCSICLQNWPMNMSRYNSLLILQPLSLPTINSNSMSIADTNLYHWEQKIFMLLLTVVWNPHTICHN